MPETDSLSFEALKSAVAGDPCALRCRAKLQPAGGEGTKVFPPTYSGSVYAIEQRRLPGRDEPVTCVLLDSVQSQANRMEAALQQAVDEGSVQIPLIEVDFSEANEQLLKPIDDRVTSLTVPHRLADAILRDSIIVEDGEDQGKLFRDSTLAERWRRASAANATPIYELCPTALLFGIWGSPEKPGGLGAKFQRCITSEIVGIDALSVESRQGLRRDPLGVVRNAAVTVEENGRWSNAKTDAKGTKRPSEINHGPILFGPTHGGVTFAEAEQTVVLTLAGLRWLRFPKDNGKWEPTEEQTHRDDAARAVLAAIGLYAATRCQESGHDLRSGCLLSNTEVPRWELLGQAGQHQPFKLSGKEAENLLETAIREAEQAGITWRSEPMVLRPSDDLVQLILRSQEHTAKEGQEAE